MCRRRVVSASASGCGTEKAAGARNLAVRPVGGETGRDRRCQPRSGSSCRGSSSHSSRGRRLEEDGCEPAEGDDQAWVDRRA